MYSLLKKDFWVLAKLRNFLIVCFYIIIFGTIFDSLIGSTLLVTLYLILDLVNQDEKYDTNRYINSLPIKRKDIVTVKYLEGLIFSVTGFLLTLLVSIGYSLYSDKATSGPSFNVILGTLIAVLFLSSLYFPCYFKFGRVAYYVVFIAIFGVMSAVFALQDRAFGIISGVDLDQPFLKIVITLIALVLYYMSHLLSVRIYEKKRT
ncbi:ABC-2 transporter permease [Priestia aryabhattai]|uniref:ABC-2 transporter permease n=1 Tax=Priestia aryabhattai TaxID=412384 RepID=UPI002E1D661C|nr:ABC-2 transporter permease [Priestia aryabhattai]